VRLHPAFAAALLSLAAAAPAQILRGLDVTGSVDQVTPGTCTSGTVCPVPASVIAPHSFPLGGSDWDNCTNTLWVTDGNNIVNVGKNCNVICTLPGIPGQFWTGLAVDCIGRRLYAMEVGGQISEFLIGTNCLTFNSRCNFPINPVNITGLAYDGFNNRIWAVDASGRAYSINYAANGCTLFCTFQAVCNPPIAQVSGLAFDSCSQLLYMYDQIPGTVLPRLITNQITGACGQTINCCNLPPASPGLLSGLAFEPTKAFTAGPGCSGVNCPPCSPQIGAQGMPVIGSSNCFKITLTNAPCPSSAFLFLSFGPCNLTNFNLCGPVHINLGAVILQVGAVIPPCTPNCGGTASIPIGIPSNPLLCGLPLGAQWAMVCAAGGISLTGGLSITLVGP
jgi:hypothetical protein